jgi:hypothetical protein
LTCIKQGRGKFLARSARSKHGCHASVAVAFHCHRRDPIRQGMPVEPLEA